MLLPSRILMIVSAYLSMPVSATRFSFINQCPHEIQLWDNSQLLRIPVNAPPLVQDVARAGLMWRHGYDPEATLAEFTVIGDGKAWYDISIIPPGTGWCQSYEACRAVSTRRGFNTALAIIPQSNVNGANCRALYCLQDGCPDAYHYPADNSKTFNCPDTTAFNVVFCPQNPSVLSPTPSTQAPYAPSTPAPSRTTLRPQPALTPAPSPSTSKPAPTPKPKPTSIPTVTPKPMPYKGALFTYTGRQAGNVPGWYDMVTSLARCQRTRVWVNSPVGPLSEEVSMVFRGPMEIYDIAVFDGSSGAQWNKVSSYKRGGTTQNIYFMNNKNIDYSGKNLHGPQIFASADGKTGSTLPRTFLGTLAEAADPSKIGGGPGVDTGVEVNIMTQRKCSKTSCRGYHDTSYSYHGWGGGKKIFVTRVQMPRGRKPDQPAIWMLNAQTMYSGQYSGCNCRGVGAAGGCGELDIVEVIETNTARDRISTHYYFYDGSVQNPPGGDNFAPRPLNQPTVYITIIDDSGAGMVKILEVDSFNFDATVLSNAQVQQWARI